MITWDTVGNIVLIFWMASVTALMFFVGSWCDLARERQDIADERQDLTDERLDAIERRLAMDEEDSNTEATAC